MKVAVPLTVKFTVTFPLAGLVNENVYTIAVPLFSSTLAGDTETEAKGLATPVDIIILAKGTVDKVASACACNQLDGL